MFKFFIKLRISAKITIIISLFAFITFLYWIVLPREFLAPALYVIPLYLVAIGLPLRISWISLPITLLLGLFRDLNINLLPTQSLIQKYLAVTPVLLILFILGAQLKKAYDELIDAQKKLQLLYDKANIQANIDYLTKLGNHRFFQQSLTREIEMAQTNQYPVGLIMIDIDNFKLYNDANGHQAGDILLNGAATIIRKNIRENDIACRYGGEEFVIILPKASRETIKEIGERIRKSFEETTFPGVSNQPGGKVTISGGISSFPEDAATAAELIKIADNKLYSVKNKTKNSVA